MKQFEKMWEEIGWDDSQLDKKTAEAFYNVWYCDAQDK